jgi:phenylacetate-CoA ligase
MPVLAFVEGRVDDLLFTAEGRPIGRLDPVFKGGIQIREAQIVQESLMSIRVRYVPADGFTASDADDIASRLRARMGDVTVRLEPVAAIPRGANGKFRAVVCDLPFEERQRLSAAP